MPTRLAARYAEAAADPRLLELSADVALVDTRLGELLGQLDSGESGRAWVRVRAAYAAIRAAVAAQDSGALKAALAQLDDALQGSTSDSSLWDEITGLLESRRKLVESEAKRMQTMAQMITSQQAMVLLAAVTAVIRRNVSDERVLSVISNEIRLLAEVGADV